MLKAMTSRWGHVRRRLPLRDTGPAEPGRGEVTGEETTSVGFASGRAAGAGSVQTELRSGTARGAGGAHLLVPSDRSLSPFGIGRSDHGDAELAADDETLDLARALADLEDLRV